MSHPRHKPETSLNDFSPPESSKGKLDVKLDPSKKSATLGRKKVSLKIENERKQHLMFENDFVNSETDSPVITKTKFNFENEFETSEAESPITRYSKSMKRNLRPATKLPDRETSKSLFEDDFSPTDKTSTSVEDNGIAVIAEETVSETRVSFTENNRSTSNEVRKQTKHILAKNRIANNIRGDGHIKKSESVNIFARENDPFDDDFFSGRDSAEKQKVEKSKLYPNNVSEFKWIEDFDYFPEEK